MQKGTEQEKELAARALWNLALLDDNHARIATGLVPLIQLLKTGTSGAKQASAKALSILAVDDKYSQRLVAAGCILPLVQMLVASDGEKEAAAGALANIAYDEDSRKAIAHAGAIGAAGRVCFAHLKSPAVPSYTSLSPLLPSAPARRQTCAWFLSSPSNSPGHESSLWYDSSLSP